MEQNSDEDLENKILYLLKKLVHFVGGRYLIASGTAKVGQLVGGVILPEFLASQENITYLRGIGFIGGSYVGFWTGYIASHWNNIYKQVLEERGQLALLREISNDFIALETVYFPTIMLGGIVHSNMSKYVHPAVSYVITTIGLTVIGGRWNKYYRECRDDGGLMYSTRKRLSSLFTRYLSIH